MTIRPLRLEYVGRYKKNYRYATYETHDHRKCRIGGSGMIKATNTFWKKILSYPITALGYDFGFKAETEDLHNPKFDRIDVIKALDFWIEHWVYQNKKDYILEGTVNKDFELTVRELIETREAVLKMPTDTEFVRQKIRFELSDELKQEIARNEKEFKDWMIEITENVLDGGNSSASTVDQFCYVVRRMTYKEYMAQNNKPYATLYNWEENFRDGRRFNFGGLDDEMSTQLWGGRHTNGVSVPERPPDTIIREFDHSTNMHSNLHPGIPSSTEPRAIGMMGEEGMITNIVGAAGEQLHVGDLIFMDNNNSRWYKATQFGPTPTHISVRPTTSVGEIVEAVREGTFIYPPGSIVSLIPGSTHLGFDSNENVLVRINMRDRVSTDDDFQIISVPITAQTVTITDDESDSLVFENMHLSSIDGFNFSADPDTSMTVPVVFTRDNTEITMNLFLTPTQQIHMFDGPLGTVHRIQITNPNDPNNWRVEIDGTEYHVVADINITTR